MQPGHNHLILAGKTITNMPRCLYVQFVLFKYQNLTTSLALRVLSVINLTNPYNYASFSKCVCVPVPQLKLLLSHKVSCTEVILHSCASESLPT